MENQEGNEGITSALYIWNGLTAFWGTSFHTDPHFHDSLQLVFDIDKTFKLKDKSNNWSDFSAAVIRTSHVHQLDSNKSVQLFLYLDKESEYAQKITEKYLFDTDICNLANSNIRKISTGFFKELLVNTDCDKLFQGFVKIIQHLIEIEQSQKKDERIEKAIAFIEKSNGGLKVKDVAEHVFLSESRLRHLFKKEVGQSIQGFMLWMKIINSINPILKGDPITQTAYDKGFWDASHMNRSFKELLGVAPSELKKYEKDLKVIPCEKVNFYTFKTEILADWKSIDPYRIVKI